MLSLILTKLDFAEDEELSRFARLYGSSIQRLVTAGLEFFDRTVRPRAESLELSHEEQDQWAYEKAAGYTQLVARLVPLLQQRHREYGVRAYLTGPDRGLAGGTGIGTAPPRQPPAIAFLDLSGYTRLAEERGDEAAAEVAADLAGVVRGTAESHGGRPVKWLGDGVMFHFNDPAGRFGAGSSWSSERSRRSPCPPASASTPAP